MPFGGFIEHTNYIPASRYGGNHVVYLSDYVLPDDPKWTMPDRDLWELYLPAVARLAPELRAGAGPRAPPLPGRVRAADRRDALLARPPAREDRRPGPLLRRDGAGLPGGPGPELRREDRARGGRGAPRGPRLSAPPRPAPDGMVARTETEPPESGSRDVIAGRERTAPPAGRRIVRWLAPLASAAVLLAALAGTSETYTVETRRDVPSVTAFGRTFALPAYRGISGLVLSFGPQTRYSTPQVLVPRRSLLRDGAEALAAIVRGRQEERTEYPIGRGVSVRFRHVNPFRAAVELKPGAAVEHPPAGGTYRLEVNVPDRSIEFWHGEQRLEIVPLPPPGPNLILFPLLASAAAAALVLSLVSLPRPRVAAVTPQREARLRPATVAVLLGAAGVLAGTAVFLGVFRAMPGFGDEMNYLFEARLFASGRTWAPEPALWEFFKVDWMDLFGADGRVWGFHPPGNAVILAIGWLVGVRWITVPVILGLNLVATWYLGLRLLGSRQAALLGVALAATSHYFLSLELVHGARAELPLSRPRVAPRPEVPRRAAARPPGPRRRGVRRGVRRPSDERHPRRDRPGRPRPRAATPARHPCPRGRRGRRAPRLLARVLLHVSPSPDAGVPYAVKGPEAGQTLAVRLNKGPGFAQTNVYRNLNEFQHRVHSFGIVLNTAPFFVPALLLRRRTLRRAPGEPRVRRVHAPPQRPSLVRLEVGTEDAVRRLVPLSSWSRASGSPRCWPGSVHATWPARAVGAAAAAAVAWRPGRPPEARADGVPRLQRGPLGRSRRDPAAGRDECPGLLRAEEHPRGVHPDDAPGFDGPVVYALHRGQSEDYRLVSDPGPDHLGSLATDTLEPGENFLRADAARLGGDLTARGLRDATVVVPWCRVAPSPRLERIPGRLVDTGELLADLGRAARAGEGPKAVVLVGAAVDLADFLVRSFPAEPLALQGYEGRIRGMILDPRGGVGFGGRIPGLRMTCTEGIRWDGAIRDRRFVSSFDLAACSGEERSVRWEGELVLEAPHTLNLALESDDGCAVRIDGRTVLDNGVDSPHETTRRTAAVSFAPGSHGFEVKYFNGPGEASLVLEAGVDGAPLRPLAAASHPGELLLAAEPFEPRQKGEK